MNRLELAKRIYTTAHLEGHFTLRSGATSTEYFDKYLFEADPALLKAIAEHMVALIPEQTDLLAGLELGGVPVATVLSQVMGLPVVFVRKKAKEYGTCKLAEGPESGGKRLTIVEDVVTSGGQIIESANALRALGATVAHVICVIDREACATVNLAKEGLAFRPLFTMSELKQAARQAAD